MIANAIPVARRIHRVESKTKFPPFGTTQVYTGMSVPTVGAEALLYILRYTAVAPVFDATML